MMWDMKSYRHLTTAERELIFLYHGQGKSTRRIGTLLGRSSRSIGRELERNSRFDGLANKNVYSPSRAERLSIQRRIDSKVTKLEADPALLSFVVKKLGLGWSPEQIAGRLKLKASESAVSHETVYQFIYAKQNKTTRLWEFLRRGHKRRQVKGYRKASSYKHLEIPGRIFIEERPQEADQRRSFGHFETDDMEGLRNEREAVSATVDRKTTYLLLDRLESQEATVKARALTSRLTRFPFSWVKTITFDNGRENRHHLEVAESLKCKTYFCHPYHSWENGTVENAIGLVRGFLPKKTSLKDVTQSELNTIAYVLNSRPRKKLNYYTPQEAVYNEIKIGSLQV